MPTSRLTRDEYLLSYHGIIIGETRCPNCDRFHAESEGRCECGMPWSMVCAGWDHQGQHHACTGGGFEVSERYAAGWTRPHGRCKACRRAPITEQYKARIPEVFPGLSRKISQALDFHALDHRQDLDAALRCDTTTMLLVWGGCGSGKTVAVLRWALDQHLDGKTVLWCSSHDLVHLFKRVTPEAESAELWRALRSSDVVVIDDFQGFACRDWTPNVAAEMGFLIQGLMDRDARSVLISNRTPDEIFRDSGELGERTRSRFAEQGRAVSCVIDDMRG